MTRRIPKPRFRPRLDRLEARDCPAVTVARDGFTLYLTGDAADDRVAVRDEGLQTVEVQTDRGTEIFREIRRVVGNLGDGDDTFEFRQAERPSESLTVRLDLGAGDDRFLYPSPPPDPEQPPPDPDRGHRATYRFDIRAGIGNDIMNMGPGVVPGLGVEIRADLGDGGDAFEFRQGDRPMESLTVAVDLAAGDDRFRIFPPPDEQAPPVPESPAKWHFDIRGGFGNDVAIIQPCIVPGLDLSVVADLGDGDDALDAAFEGPAAPVGIILPGVSLEVAAGEGNDAVEVAIGNPEVLDPLRVADVRVGIHGFGGDDSGIIIICNVAVTGRLTAAMDLGDGDDAAQVAVGNPNDLTLTTAQKVRVHIATGAGDDTAQVSVGGVTVSGPTIVAIDTGGGDDGASVLLPDSEEVTAFGGPVTLRVGLGDGEDLANLVVRDANDVAGPLTVAVDGGAGDDGIVADVDFTPRVRAEQLDPGNAPASVLVALRGGDGRDTIDAYTEGVWNGLARFALRGGGGEDDLGFHGVTGAGSAGVLAVAMDGGAGDDMLGGDLLLPADQSVPIHMRLLAGAGDDVLSVNLLGGPDTTPEPHLFVLDGGDGFDLARAPAGAIVRNCEGQV
jgi:hypothetical protein